MAVSNLDSELRKRELDKLEAGLAEMLRIIPAKEIAAWCNAHVHRGQTIIVPGVGHSFRGGEGRIARAIREWMK